MPEERLNGYWERKNDPADYIFVERVWSGGHVRCFQYFKRNGQEVIETTPFKITHEELKEKYKRRV